MIRSASSPCDGKVTLEHVVTVILKQPMDGPLSKALACAGIHTTLDILALTPLARDALTYHDDYGIVKPLLIGHKNQLQVLKIFATYRKMEGFPIVNWMTITKKDFDDFRCSRAGLRATEMDDAIAPVTVSITTFESSPTTMPATASKSSPSATSLMTSKNSLHMDSSDVTEDQDVLACSIGKTALHHVLSEVLGQPWWLIFEVLERSGFDGIQDVLLMNQAERDTLTFLNGNGVVTPLPRAEKDTLLKINLFGSYR